MIFSDHALFFIEIFMNNGRLLLVILLFVPAFSVAMNRMQDLHSSLFSKEVDLFSASIKAKASLWSTYFSDIYTKAKRGWTIHSTTKGSRFRPFLNFLRQHKGTIAASFTGTVLAIIFTSFCSWLIKYAKKTQKSPQNSPKNPTAKTTFYPKIQGKTPALPFQTENH